ncbi:hypothetical protein KA405_04485 [Patescibacteria group bacterium]|nr:hypothetical protein [Patescibacteria group bacterium]
METPTGRKVLHKRRLK